MAPVSRVGVGLDLMEQALDVGDVGVRVAADTWLRWMTLTGKLALISAGQGVGALRGLDTTGPLEEAFKSYIGDLADLPGKAGKAFELQWEAVRNRPREAEFRTLLVPDVPHWQSWTRLAGKLAQVSTAWQKNLGRADRRYGERLRRITQLPLQASRDLEQARRRLLTIMRPNDRDPVEALIPATATRDATGTQGVVRVLSDDVIGRLSRLAWRATTPAHEVTNALGEYGKLLAGATDVAVTMGRAYDRQANRYGMAWGLSQAWTREQAEADEYLTQLLDLHRQRLSGAGSRITVQEVERVLQACDRELTDLSRLPARAARESNAALELMIKQERQRPRRPQLEISLRGFGLGGLGESLLPDVGQLVSGARQLLGRRPRARRPRAQRRRR